MAYTFTPSNHFKYLLITQGIDLDGDTIYASLVRDDFVFNKDAHHYYTNIYCTSGALSLVFDAGDRTITRSTGSFITDGFIATNRIVTSSAVNPGPFIISSVSQYVITVDEALYDESISCSVTSKDELDTNYGYTRGGQAVTVNAPTEDTTDNRGEATINDLVWTAASGTIGPTAGCIMWDDTEASDSIIGYFDFLSNRYVPSGSTITIDAIEIRLT